MMTVVDAPHVNQGERGKGPDHRNSSHLLTVLCNPQPEHFTRAFLAQVPVDQVRRGLQDLHRQRGVAISVSPAQDGASWTVLTPRGTYDILARFDAGTGRLSSLQIPTAEPSSRRQRVTPLGWALMLLLNLTACVLAWTQPTLMAWLGHTPWALLLGAALLPTTVWAHLSTAVRPVLVLGLLAAAASLPHALTLPAGTFAWGDGLLTLLVTLLLLPLLVDAWKGQRRPRHAIHLGPVLQGGRFMVAHGGGTATLNYHMDHPPMRYAVDVIGVGPLGRMARGLFPPDPARYSIFGAAVLAPLSGTVIAAQGHWPDQSVPRADTLRPAGNHVVLEGRTADSTLVRVVLAHLQQHSVTVEVGDAVTQGQVIGRVGNSGNTSEPHLHLGVSVGDPGRDRLGGEGMPFTLNGRWPVRGMVLNA